jgi:UDPglucose 6-dehydrogenase
VVVVTEWESVRQLDLDLMRQLMRSPILIDLRNVFGRGAAQAGFQVSSVGRPASTQSDVTVTIQPVSGDPQPEQQGRGRAGLNVRAKTLMNWN